ncbi:uncharacterized protein LOC132732258 [Ruditapes philippinarum]|uniref:uncharacterized protein LOC132732258 n=1 Tax=Ruditapes philippinarum TaxID=129788 RepID=UPI00295BEC3B|nr:uncharacterized protein LOC132732258 [Ruditapes philippinarum]
MLRTTTSFKWETCHKNGNDEQSQDKTKRFEGKEILKVLVYDAEKGETTRFFIEALKRQLDVFEFQDFHAANDEEKDTLSIIAVVRHISIHIIDIINDVKEQFVKDDVHDLERVFVTYFYVNRSDEYCIQTIKQISESGQFNFAKIVPMNFIDTSLVRKLSFFGNFLKSDNKDSLHELKGCILSRKVRKKVCVNVYGAMDSLQIKDFIAKLSQVISSSIYLQATKPLEEMINITSPTLICTTGDLEECQEKLKEKDLRKCFLVHLIDVGMRSEICVMHDSPYDMENTSVIHEEQNPSSTLSSSTV